MNKISSAIFNRSMIIMPNIVSPCLSSATDLRAGKYPYNTDILDLPFTPPTPTNPTHPVPMAAAIRKWTNEPSIVKHVKGQNSHWQISLDG